MKWSLLFLVELGLLGLSSASQETVVGASAAVGEESNGPRMRLFSCPESQGATATASKAENDFDGYWTTYQEMNQEKLEQEGFVNFRDSTYDYRWLSYTDMKAQTAAWKRDFFATAGLKNSDHIYESACGQGLNLFQTLENLRECCGIVNLTAHGNDYLAESIQVAHKIYNQEASDWFHKGNLCQGDSTNLSFVPDNAVDLAYTGFIDPVLDPLKLMHSSATVGDMEDMVEEICATAQYDPEIALLADQMQRLQEDWHAKWVLELLRIVKPGKYVIIEDVGWPACSLITEWGGVDPEWWTAVAVERYGWNVEPNSIEVVDDEDYKWNDNRYQVRMMKKRADSNTSSNDLAKDLEL